MMPLSDETLENSLKDLKVLIKRNIKLKIAYDGHAYLGWQKTKLGPSVAETLEHVVQQILQHPVTLQAASRTDAGVHANGQVVNFFTTKMQLALPRLQTSLNSLLPKDIVVRSIEEMPLDFHPTLDAKGKEYCYFVCQGAVQLPQNRYTSWHVPRALDFELMQKAAALLTGKHNFSFLCNQRKNQSYADYVREIYSIDIQKIAKERFYISLKGDSFLYKMARNIAGTLIYIGSGKIPLDQLPLIMHSKNRQKAGMSAPAHALFLEQIFY